jgi:hypothetical protein
VNVDAGVDARYAYDRTGATAGRGGAAHGPRGRSPIRGEIARFALLTPVFPLLGYASMRYPAAFVVADNPLLVDDAEDVSGPAVAARRFLAFRVAAVGVAFALAAAVDSGVRPAAVALLTVGALIAGAAAILANARLAAALPGAPLVRAVVHPANRVTVEYLGIALVPVGIGGVTLLLPVTPLA